MRFLEKQKLFLGDFKSSEIAYMGGYGSGKTKAGCYKALSLAFANPGCAGMYVSPTYQMLRDTTRRTFQEILEEEHIGYIFKSSENKFLINKAKHEVWFRSADDPLKLKGPNLAWSGLDEPGIMTIQAYDEVIARVRDPKAKFLQTFLTGTYEGFNWLTDLTDKIKTINVSTWENLEENGGFLPRSYIDKLLERYDEKLIQQYIEGKPANITAGQVYYEFGDYNLDENIVYNPSLPLFWTHDFNVRPLCSGIWQYKNGEYYKIAEIILQQAITKDTVEEFIKLFGNHDGEIYIYGDSIGRAGSTKSSETDYDIILGLLARHFGGKRIYNHSYEANPSVKDTVAVVNAKLKNANGIVRIFINPNTCPFTVKAFQRTSWMEEKWEIDKRPKAGDWHNMTDADRYFISYTSKNVI